MLTQKRCTKCVRLYKNVPANFYRKESNADGYDYYCKSCTGKNKKTPIAKLTQLYTNLICRLDKQGSYTVEFSRGDFEVWARRNGFMNMHKKWRLSNYNRKLAPSIKRTSSSLSLTLDNIELVPFGDIHTLNNLGERPVPVVKYSLDGKLAGVYPTVAIAADTVGAHQANVSRAAARGKGIAGGFMWRQAHVHIKTNIKPYGPYIEVRKYRGRKIHKFDSITEVVKALGVSRYVVVEGCKNPKKAMHGYYFNRPSQHYHEMASKVRCFKWMKDLKDAPHPYMFVIIINDIDDAGHVKSEMYINTPGTLSYSKGSLDNFIKNIQRD